MTIRGGVRSLNARLARLEEKVPEPQGPIEYRAYFYDGTPVWPGLNDEPPVDGRNILYRIASWDEAGLTGVRPARNDG